MPTPYLQYRQLRDDLHRVRSENGGFPSDEEELLLNKMDVVWVQLSEEEIRRVRETTTYVGAPSLYMLEALKTTGDASPGSLTEIELKLVKVEYTNDAPVIDCLIAHIGGVVRLGGSLTVPRHDSGLTAHLEEWASRAGVTISAEDWAKLDGAIEMLFHIRNGAGSPVWKGYDEKYPIWRDRVLKGLHASFMSGY